MTKNQRTERRIFRLDQDSNLRGIDYPRFEEISEGDTLKNFMGYKPLREFNDEIIISNRGERIVTVIESWEGKPLCDAPAYLSEIEYMDDFESTNRKLLSSHREGTEGYEELRRKKQEALIN